MLPVVCTEEQYLARHGVGRDRIGDAGLHKTHTRFSKKQWDKKLQHQSEIDTEVIKKRDALREQYRQKVAAGELRPPTRIERLQSIAAGHPDNEAVQAARRILASMEIEW